MSIIYRILYDIANVPYIEFADTREAAHEYMLAVLDAIPNTHVMSQPDDAYCDNVEIKRYRINGPRTDTIITFTVEAIEQ